MRKKKNKVYHYRKFKVMVAHLNGHTYITDDGYLELDYDSSRHKFLRFGWGPEGPSGFVHLETNRPEWRRLYGFWDMESTGIPYPEHWWKKDTPRRGKYVEKGDLEGLYQEQLHRAQYMEPEALAYHLTEMKLTLRPTYNPAYNRWEHVYGIKAFPMWMLVTVSERVHRFFNDLSWKISDFKHERKARKNGTR